MKSDEKQGSERRRVRRIPLLGPARILSVGDDDQLVTTEVEIEDLSDGGYGVTAEVKLPVGEMVWLRRKTDEIHKAVVRYSRHVGGLRWRTGLLLLPKERRRAGRERAEGPAYLTWIDEKGSRRSLAVTVANVSEIGAGVIASVATPSGVLATLSGEALVCSCLIRHCVEENGCYRVGLLFTSTHKDRAAESSDDWLD